MSSGLLVGGGVGAGENQISSTRLRVMSPWASSPAPVTTRFPRCCFLTAVTLSVSSPSSKVAFHCSGPLSVRDATYLGIAFMRAA